MSNPACRREHPTTLPADRQQAGLKVLFMGTPRFAARHLEALLDGGVDVVGVVTQPARPKGRSGTPQPSEVAQVATERGLPLFEASKPSAENVFDQLAPLQPDLIVVVAYGALLRQNLLELPKISCINVHPSLLPKYRGAAPMRRAIIEGERETGVCIMHLTKELDAGDVILVEKTPIGSDETFGEVQERLCRMGCKLLLEAIKKLGEGSAPRTPQDHQAATYAHKIEQADCQLDFSKPALELHNLVRGLSPKPGAWCQVRVKGQSRRLKVFRTALGSEGLCVTCGEGSLQLLEVQLEGKKQMSADDLLRGYSRSDLEFSETR